MKYAQCKCGNMQMWTSGMPLTKCSKCSKCGSGYGYGPNSHIDPLPHEYETYPVKGYDQDNVTKTICKYCNKTKKQIEGGEG